MKAVILAGMPANQFSQKVAGVPLITRTIRTVKQAGVDQFVIVTGGRGNETKRAIEAELQDVAVDWVHNDEWWKSDLVALLKAKDRINRNAVVLKADSIFEPSMLAALGGDNIEGKAAVLCVDKKLDSIAFLEGATKVKIDQDKISDIDKNLQDFDAVSTGMFLCSPDFLETLDSEIKGENYSLSDGIKSLAQDGEVGFLDIEDRFWMRVSDEKTAKQAKKLLFKREAIKPTSGFIEKFDRRLSVPISKLLVHTGITPNQITIIILLIRILSVIFIYRMQHTYVALGGVLWQFAFIMDLCDGEVARVKLLASKFGAWVDTICDHIANFVLFFVGLLGLYNKTGELYFLIIGFLSIASFVASILMMSFYLKRIGAGSTHSYEVAFSDMAQEKGGFVYKFLDKIKFMAKADFRSLLIFILTLLNRVDWLFWMLVAASGLVTLCVSISLGGLLKKVSAHKLEQ